MKFQITIIIIVLCTLSCQQDKITEYYFNGEIKSIAENTEGGPTLKEFNELGLLVNQYWENDKKKIKGTHYKYYKNGEIKEKYNTLQNEFHGPATFYHLNGDVKFITEYYKGKTFHKIGLAYDSVGNQYEDFRMIAPILLFGDTIQNDSLLKLKAFMPLSEHEIDVKELTLSIFFEKYNTQRQVITERSDNLYFNNSRIIDIKTNTKGIDSIYITGKVFKRNELTNSIGAFNMEILIK